MGDIHHLEMATSSKSRCRQAFSGWSDFIALEAWRKDCMEAPMDLQGNTYDSTRGMRIEGDVQAQV
ncbi:MAG: hypothetical protein BVN29_15440 [Nitrospira sp. ST-bin5]|nr:MAG: hypothetical protein BVN29_15440 [Nitrospira sp. ST-bin5]